MKNRKIIVVALFALILMTLCGFLGVYARAASVYDTNIAAIDEKRTLLNEMMTLYDTSDTSEDKTAAINTNKVILNYYNAINNLRVDERVNTESLVDEVNLYYIKGKIAGECAWIYEYHSGDYGEDAQARVKLVYDDIITRIDAYTDSASLEAAENALKHELCRAVYTEKIETLYSSASSADVKDIAQNAVSAVEALSSGTFSEESYSEVYEKAENDVATQLLREAARTSFEEIYDEIYGAGSFAAKSESDDTIKSFLESISESSSVSGFNSDIETAVKSVLNAVIDDTKGSYTASLHTKLVGALEYAVNTADADGKIFTSGTMFDGFEAELSKAGAKDALAAYADEAFPDGDRGEKLTSLLNEYNSDGGIFDEASDAREIEFELGRAKLRVDWLDYISDSKDAVSEIFGTLDSSEAISQLEALYAPTDEAISSAVTLEAARDALGDAKTSVDDLKVDFEVEVFLKNHADIIAKSADGVTASDAQELKSAISDFGALSVKAKTEVSDEAADLVSKYKKAKSLEIEALVGDTQFETERKALAKEYTDLIDGLTLDTADAFILQAENIVEKAKTAFLIRDEYEDIVSSGDYPSFSEAEKTALSQKLDTYIGRACAADHTSSDIKTKLDSILASAKLELCRCESEALLNLIRSDSDSDAVKAMIDNAVTSLNYADSVEALEEIVSDTELDVYRQRKTEEMSAVIDGYKKDIALLEYLKPADITGAETALDNALASAINSMKTASGTAGVDSAVLAFGTSAKNAYDDANAQNVARAKEYHSQSIDDKKKELIDGVKDMDYIEAADKTAYEERISNAADSAKQSIASMTDVSEIEDMAESYASQADVIYGEAESKNLTNAKASAKSEAQKADTALKSKINALEYIDDTVRSAFLEDAQEIISKLNTSVDSADSVDGVLGALETYSAESAALDTASDTANVSAAKKHYAETIDNSAGETLGGMNKWLGYLDSAYKAQAKSELDALVLDAKSELASANTVADAETAWINFRLAAAEIEYEAESRNFENAKLAAKEKVQAKADEITSVIDALEYLLDAETEAAKAAVQNILSAALSDIDSSADVSAAETKRDTALGLLENSAETTVSQNLENAREDIKNKVESKFNEFNSADYTKEKYDIIKGAYEKAMKLLDEGSDIKTFGEIMETAFADMSAVSTDFEDVKSDVIQRLKDAYEALEKISDRYSEKNFTSVKEIYERTVSEIELSDKSKGKEYIQKLADERIALMQSVKVDWVSSGNLTPNNSGYTDYPAGFDYDDGLWAVVSGSNGISSDVKLGVSVKDASSAHSEALKYAIKNSSIAYFGENALNDKELADILEDSVIRGVIDIKLIRQSVLYDEFSGKYTVKVLLPSDMRDISRPAAIYFAADGRAEYYDASIEGAFLVFETEHFSEFVIVGEKTLNLTPVIIILGIAALIEAAAAVVLTIAANKKRGTLLSVMLLPSAALKVIVPKAGIALVCVLAAADVLLAVYIVFAAKRLLDAAKETNEETAEEFGEEAFSEDVASEEDTQDTAAHLPVILDSVSAEEADTLISDSEIAEMIVHSEEGPEICRGCKKTFINVDTISDNFESGDTVSLAELKEKKLVPQSACFLKVLARGEINKPLVVKAQSFSANAVKMISLTGGTAVIEGNAEYVENKNK
ncbi:MAG: uL15 family ribosomal protein [Clostridia bacterium]|nr:uL15 family ribosomal protein [Clostridia bacterium]